MLKKKDSFFNRSLFHFWRITIFLQYFCILSIYGQSSNYGLMEKSDSLFTLGVEKYKSKQFDVAIPIFRECCDVDSIIYEPNSSRLGYASMWLASCYYSLGDIVTASSVSDYYMVKPIDRRLTVKSDSISDLIYPILFEKQDVVSALSLIREVLRLEIEELGENSIWVGNTYNMYGFALLMSGCLEDARSAFNKSLSIAASQCGENSKAYAFLLADQVSAHSQIGDLHSAYTIANQVLDICKSQNIDDFNLCYTANLACGDYMLNDNKYAESIPFWSESLRLLSANGMDTSPECAIVLNGLGLSHLLTGDVVNAKNELEKSYLLLKQTREEYDKIHLAESMDYLSQAYFILGDTISAVKLNEEAIAFFENGDVEKNCLYPKLLFNLWNIYEALNRPESCQFAEKALDNYRALDCKDINYASLLFRYSKRVSEDNGCERAIVLASEALSFIKQLPDIPDTILVMYQCRLSECYSDCVNLDSAYYYARQALQNMRSSFHSKSINYVAILDKLAPTIWFYGNKKEAMQLYQEALCCIETLSPNSEIHYQILKELSRVYWMSGYYTDAVDSQKKTLRMAESLYGQDSELYSEAATSLVQYLNMTGESTEKQDVLNQVGAVLTSISSENVQYVKQKVLSCVHSGNYIAAEQILDDFCKDIVVDSLNMKLEYANLFYARAEIKNKLGKYNEALLSLQMFYDMYTEKYGKDMIEKYYYNYWSLLGQIFFNQKKLDEAEDAFDKGVSSAILVFGEDNMDCLSMQAVLTMVRFQKGEDEGSIKKIRDLYKKVREIVFLQFSMMSSSERMVFWLQISALYSQLMPFMAYVSTNSAFYGDVYNALLLSKGLLLSTEQQVLQILRDSNDKKAVELYEKLLLCHKRISSLQISAQPSNIAECDSLREVIRQGERELIAISSAYGDYTRNLRFTWEDVRNCLGKDDVAIEFTDFYDNDGSNLYVALVLKNNMETPQMIKLFDYSQFSGLDSHGYYKNDSLYNLVWKPVEPYLSKGAKIYFSPQGILHSLAIESLPTNDGTSMSENYRIYRLSSTRELCVEYTSKFARKAALYGGIDYNAEKASVLGSKEENGELVAQENENEKQEMLDVNVLRGALQDNLPDLPGTAVEVDSIARLFAFFNCPVQKITGEAATEKSFKTLNKNDYTILHIATHGYYISNSEKTGNTYLAGLISSRGMSQEDMTLTHSGLFFAGANITILDSFSADHNDDGILTAYEVSKLNMSDYDLVSLSACQTGLGDVSGDGVFGLQRGFKKAGVRSLLMSLWEVDDSATCKLMTTFYRYWLEGHSKYDALEYAKSVVRSISGWEDPSYWAGFILLDGLN